jgi:hypothetical protein
MVPIDGEKRHGEWSMPSALSRLPPCRIRQVLAADPLSSDDMTRRKMRQLQARSLQEVTSRIGKYRRTEIGAAKDPQIGCVILVEPFFFEERNWIDVLHQIDKTSQMRRPSGLTPIIVARTPFSRARSCLRRPRASLTNCGRNPASRIRLRRPGHRRHRAPNGDCDNAVRTRSVHPGTAFPASAIPTHRRRILSFRIHAEFTQRFRGACRVEFPVARKPGKRRSCDRFRVHLEEPAQMLAILAASEAVRSEAHQTSLEPRR